MKKHLQFIGLNTVLLIFVGCGSPQQISSNPTPTTSIDITASTTTNVKSEQLAQFTSNELNLTFSYPTKFSDDPQCSPEMNEGKLWFLGGQIMMARVKLSGTIELATKKEITGFAPEEFIEKNIFINSEPAKRIDWHTTGGTNDFGTIVLVKHSGYLYKLTINGKPTWPCLTNYSDEQLDVFFTNLYSSLKFK